MDLLSFVISVCSFGLAIFATFTANSARQAAASAVRRTNNQEDRETLTALISVLDKAKEAAKLRQNDALEELSRGRSLPSDILLLTDAGDALRTNLPLCFGDDLKAATEAAADEIRLALGRVQNPTTPERDGWADALAALQNLIRNLRQEEREMKTKEVLPD